MSAEYNGHPSRLHWLAALHLANEESLYVTSRNMFRNYVRTYSVEDSLRKISEDLADLFQGILFDELEYTPELMRYALECTLEEEIEDAFKEELAEDLANDLDDELFN